MQDNLRAHRAAIRPYDQSVQPAVVPNFCAVLNSLIPYVFIGVLALAHIHYQTYRNENMNNYNRGLFTELIQLYSMIIRILNTMGFPAL